MAIQKQPKQIINDKTKHAFIICKLPAIVGRELSREYINSNLPVIGNTSASTKAMTQLLSYVNAIDSSGKEVNLGTSDLIENHIEDTEELLWLEWEMVKYNFGFLANINPFTLLLRGINKVLEAFKSTVTSTPSSDTSLVKEQ